MERDGLPEDPAKQWEVLLCIIAFEEKKIDRRPDGAIETLTYVFNHKGIRHIFTEWIQQMKLCYDKQMSDEDTSGKNDAISILWRQRGNVKFRAELFEESHKLYTKSILYANKDGPLYPLALANRAAALLRMGKYKDSLRDVQRALKYKYPPEIKHKLFLRRAECYCELGQRTKCIEAMRQAVKYNEMIQLKGLSKVDFDRSYRQLEEKLVNLKYDEPPDELILPDLHLGENPDFKAASNAIELVRNDQYGRHVIVKEPLKRGDVVFAEEPFASVKLRESELPHPYYCDYCCCSEPTMITCKDCSRIVFCDEACYYLASAVFHRWECPGIRANIFQIIGIAHLAFRVMLKYASRGLPKLPEGSIVPTTAAALLAEYDKVDTIAVFKKEYPTFYRMYSLSSNLDSSANTDNIQYALTSTMLTLYLEQNTKFFEFFPGQVGYPLPMSEMKLLCAALIFRSLGQMVTNAHTVMELNTGQRPDMPIPCTASPWRKIGTGVYPAISMMNHSCEPNITNVFYKNTLYIKVIHEMPKGTEILNCYGPHYARASTEERREELKTQYGFNCICPACVDESRKDFVSLFSAYACPSCKGPVTWVGTKMSCHQCPNEFPLQRAQNAAETANAMHAIALRAKTKEERCERMVRSYRLMQQVLYRHHDVLRKAVDDLAMLHAAIGEYSKAIDLIKQNIQSFEYQFGSFSVEVTNEIRKMANLMLGRIMKYLDNPELDERQPMPIRDWIRETVKIAKKANQLMELNFGTWQPMYKALRENEEVLDNMLAGPRFHDHPDCFNYRIQNLNIV
ncbi:SET and MYND domain-containing protein 4-like isoform X2 [Helicoverpa zea]|uniref:SET and MYND domain-containing protein 4-like isoform X2 n=1 Tax=Helicoverpa zea TaxID=7113 RepID=UPI001F57CB65|nr:SET and MYND domain-containing protein 4-like isoform X2 [Helicoverpa zea]